MHGEHGFAPGHALPPPDHRRRSDLPFTFMEILIAGMILTLAIAMTLGILGGARGRLLKAEQRWGRSHHLSNMTEFYLLTGPKGDLPASLLPEGFSARCDLVKAEDLPEHAAEGVPGWDDWQLGQFHVAVTAPSGNTIGKWVVEKLVREDDCD
jgi:hypothetical protein